MSHRTISEHENKNSELRTQNYTKRIGLAALLGVAAWVFRVPLGENLALALRDEEQSHILLAPLVALWLLWLRRERLRAVTVRPSLAGCGIVAAGCAASWFGFHTDTFIAWHGGALLALLGMVVSVIGLGWIRHALPALGAMAFMMPVPGTIRQSIAVPLQTMATDVTFSTLDLFGYDVAKFGNLLIVNGEYIAVAEACNGMRLVFSLVLVVYAFAFSSTLRPSVRLGLLVITPAIALIANFARLIPTSLLYGTAPAETATAFHDISGWLMLPLVLIGLAGLMKTAAWLELPVMHEQARRHEGTEARSEKTVPIIHPSCLRASVPSCLSLIASLAVVLLLPQWLVHSAVDVPREGPEPEVVIAAAERLPYRFGNWSGVDVPAPEPAVRLLRPNVVIARRFSELQAGPAVTLVIVHCGDARDMMGHYPPVCYRNAGWKREPVSTGRGDDHPIQQFPDGSTAVELRLGKSTFMAALYEFSQVRGLGIHSRVRVFNFFVLPDGSVTGEIGRIVHRDNLLRRSMIRSLGQVHLVIDANVDVVAATEAANQILAGVAEFFHALGVNQPPADKPATDN